MTPENRSRIYVLAFTVAIIVAAALVILAAIGIADWEQVKTIALWILGVAGIGGHGLAVANRPTKQQP